MRNLKKFLALVLAMLMTLSLMVSVNAATTWHAGTELGDEDNITEQFQEAANVLMGMGVFSGDNGNFKPEASITRAETAAVLYRLVTGDVTDAQEHIYAKYGNFPDVAEDAWYAGYVGYCANQELILGRPDGTFDPKGNVTGYEVLAMILRAVGYGTQPGEFTGSNWAVTVAYRAQALGILDNINTTRYGGATLYEPARRDVVAELLFRTDAFVPTVNWTTAFGYQDTGDVGGVTGTVKNDTLGYKVFGLTYNTGVIVGNEKTGEPEGTTKIGFSLDTQPTSGVIGIGQSNDTVVRGYNSGNTISFYSRIDDSMAIRGADYRSAYIYESDTSNTLPENVTRTFKWSSDLRQFNHAVKVWYNNKGTGEYVTVGTLTDANGNTLRDGATGRFTTNLQTYAVIDQSVKSSVVSLWAADQNSGDGAFPADLGTLAAPGNLGSAATSGTDNRNNNWNAPKMKLRTHIADSDATATGESVNAAYFNYSFGPNFANSMTTQADAGNSWNREPSAATYNNDGSYGSGVASSATDAVTLVADSVVQRNNEEQLYRLYLLISNSKDGDGNPILDVVIPLEITFSRVAQTNNTTNSRSVSILAGNEDIYGGVEAGNYTYFGDSNDYLVSRDNVNDVLFEMAQKNTFVETNKDASDRDKVMSAPGYPVAAIEVTGTAPGNIANSAGTAPADYDYVIDDNMLIMGNQGGGEGDATGRRVLWYGQGHNNGGSHANGVGNAEPTGGNNVHSSLNNGIDSTFYYHLTRNHIFVTATVLAINPENQTLTVANASNGANTLRQSVFAEATDANFTRNIEGVDKDSKTNGGSYEKVLQEGKTYTFTMDEQGNYIWWDVKNDAVEFRYGTYVDFESKLASSKFVYPMVTVDENGDQQIIDNISKIYDFHHFSAASNCATCIDPSAANDWHDPSIHDHKYDTTFWGSMSGKIYNELVLPKGDTGDNSSQYDDAGFRKGFYVGYAYDKNTGKLEAVAPYDLNDPDTRANDSRYSDFYQATGSDFGADAIVIGQRDVNIRSKQVNNLDYHVDYFLTDKTKFILVDGAGTDDQTAEVLIGLDGLRKGATTVTIDVSDTGDLYLNGNNSRALLAGAASHVGLNAWEMVYFKFADRSYAQDYVNSAYEIDTIFIPAKAVTRSYAGAGQSLYFVGDNTQTNIASVEGGIYTEFTFYDTEGVAHSLWVDGWINDGYGGRATRSSASIIAQDGMEDVFYNLVESDKKAPDGRPVYNIRNADEEAVIGRAYNGYTAGQELDKSFALVNLGNDDDAAINEWGEYQPTTLAQSAWIDDEATFHDGDHGNTNSVTARMYYVGEAKVRNLNTIKYPGITEVLATLHNAGSNTDNERVRVSCVLGSSSATVKTIFVNFIQG